MRRMIPPKQRMALVALIALTLTVVAVIWYVLDQGGASDVFLVSGLALAAMGLGIELAARFSPLVNGDGSSIQFSASACTVLGALVTAGAAADSLRTETGATESWGVWLGIVLAFVVMAALVTGIPYLLLTVVRGGESRDEPAIDDTSVGRAPRPGR
jgi:hypothetical protein